MKGKHLLITGGTGGLGLGVVPLALDRGAIVTLPYRNPAGLDRLRDRLSAADFSRLQWVNTDLGDPASVSALMGSLPRLDALIHLAGGFSMGPLESVSLQAWRSLLDLNLTSAFLLCQQALPLMRSTGYGRIVTVGSRAAREPGANQAAYSASKAGLVAFTQAIAAETKGSNITANCVLPSIIDTPSNRAAMGEAAAATWVKPEAIAELICFLASEAAADLRGAAIPIYGNL